MAIGEHFLQQYRRFCEPNWRQYAEQYGYDLICIAAPLDTSERARQRSPAWQKCLVLSQPFAEEYERIVWIDSDIFINLVEAPDISEGVPIDKVGAVELYSGPSPELYSVLLKRMYEYWNAAYGPVAVVNHTPHEYYTNYGLPYGFDKVANTGVLVFSPVHHREILEKVYYGYEEKPGKGRGVWHMEQRPLSWELMNADAFHWLDTRFNVNWWEMQFLYYPFLVRLPKQTYWQRIKRKARELLTRRHRRRLRSACINIVFASSFFLHFTGGIETSADIAMLEFDRPSWRSYAE
jgi:hypothetical protein